MKHTPHIKESTLAAACWHYAEFALSDWLDGDDRTVTVYVTRRGADHDDDLPTITIIGAATSAEHGYSEVFDRAGFADLIGKDFVGLIEESLSEEWL